MNYDIFIYMISLIEILNMTEQQIFDLFVCYAIEKQLEYEFKDSYYLWIKGMSPIALTAHVDTVCTELKKDIISENGLIKAFINNKQTILGGDDRVGIFLCYQLLNEQIETSQPFPHILLFNGEEIGGIGVDSFVSTKPDLSSIKMILSLDCPGCNKFLYYGQTEYLFEAQNYIESYGINNDGFGVFTDISVLGLEYNMPMFNIAVGYYNQHTDEEYIDIEVMNLSWNKVKRILNNEIPFYYVDDIGLKDIIHQ